MITTPSLYSSSHQNARQGVAYRAMPKGALDLVCRQVSLVEAGSAYGNQGLLGPRLAPGPAAAYVCCSRGARRAQGRGVARADLPKAGAIVASGPKASLNVPSPSLTIGLRYSASKEGILRPHKKLLGLRG